MLQVCRVLLRVSSLAAPATSATSQRVPGPSAVFWLFESRRVRRRRE